VKSFCFDHPEGSVLTFDKTFNRRFLYMTTAMDQNLALNCAASTHSTSFMGPMFVDGQSDVVTCLVKACLPDHPNIFIEVAKRSKLVPDRDLAWVMDGLCRDQQQFPKTVIYARSIKVYICCLVLVLTLFFIFLRAAVSGGCILPCCPSPVYVALFVAFLDK